MADEKANNFVAGNSLGHYRILKKIGAGGMGEVYLAEDTRLDRKVAVKILNEKFAEHESNLQRFVKEAKAASALNHPNILVIHEIGETENAHYIVSEFIEGETLREIFKSKTLRLPEVLDISIQIAGALVAAHSAHIIHRDIKPENIIVRPDGFVKILDFGLAKLVEEKNKSLIGLEDETAKQNETAKGVIMGTINYMSPEQAKGERVDGRTDIFSFGVLIYEMMAGRTPFAGNTMSETFANLINAEPQPLARFSSNAPDALQRIVGKTLRKNKDERYQTMKGLLADLKDLRQELEFQNKLERTNPPQREEAKTQIINAATTDAPSAPLSAKRAASEIKKFKFTIGLAVLLLAAIGFGFWFFAYRPTSTKQIESIAILPFVNESGNADNEYLSDGMTESLINSLSQLPKLSVKARSSVFRYKGKETDAKQVGADLNVQAVLNGRVVQRGNNLILSLELVDARTGNQIWGEQYNRKQADLVSLQNEIARDVSNKLRIKLSGADEQKVAKNYTTNNEAYQLYLKGRYHWNKRTGADIRKSVEYFQQAIDKDPTYALAYAALAEAYILIPNYTKDSPDEAIPKARAAAMKALEIDETLAEAHTALADVMYEYDWKFAEAEKEFKRAIELNPNYATAHQWYGLYLLVVGRNEEGIAEIKRAQELDPLSLIINSIVGYAYTANRQYDQAIEQLRKTIEMDQNFTRGHLYLAAAYQGKGMFEEAISEFEKHSILNGLPAEEAAKKASELREAYKKFGAKGYWRKQIEFYERRRVSHPDLVPPLSIVASFYSQIGEKEQAFAFLEKAYEKREIDLLRLKSPSYDPIRSDPRFQDLMRRIGLPQVKIMQDLTEMI